MAILIVLGLAIGFRILEQRQSASPDPAPQPQASSTPDPRAAGAAPSGGVAQGTAASPPAPNGPGVSTAGRAGRVPPDPTAACPVLATREEPAKGTNGVARRLRLVRADFKYPLWRIEETLGPDPATGLATVRSRRIQVADHVVVQFKEGAAPEAALVLARRHGLTVRKIAARGGLYLLAAAKAGLDTVPDLVRALGSDPAVRFAEPDSIVSTCATLPDDPSLDQLWGLNNTGQSGGAVDADIDAPEAWDLVTGSPDIVVGVIDSGVDYTHPDLAVNIWSNDLETANGLDDDGNGYVDDVRGWDFYANDALPLDEHGHGTHVAGTIGAAGNNAVGVVGVNWRCRIIPLRFLNASGNGVTSDAVDALYYALALRQRGVGLRLTNNSWGGGGAEQALEDAIAANDAGGLLFVAAAGNWGWDNDATPFYPSCYTRSNIIAVAATDRYDGLASFSHFGLTTVDLAAPGVSIYSTLPNGQYGLNSGTSMATPHVSGVAALLAALSPGADAATLRRALLAGVDPIPSVANRTVSGGRLNAMGAIRQLSRIGHEPLGDTYATGTPYVVEATITPSSLVVTNAAWLHWNTDGSTGSFTSVALEHGEGETWRASIPAQPFGRQVWYWLSATTTLGTILQNPADAPRALHHFSVVPPLALIVSGAPEPGGAVIPDYGWYVYPSGTVVRASASPTSLPEGPARWRCSGWTGMGSVPAAGAGQAVTVTVRRVSALEWQWTRQFALEQTSSVPGLLAATTWWDIDTQAGSVSAPPVVAEGPTDFEFAYWRLDGRRQPDDTSVAVRALTGIPMTEAHAALAVYLPALEDADADGMGDAWELFHFGFTNTAPETDSDGDGMANLDEYADRTDPTDPAVSPGAPVIVHAPLASPQAAPAPFQVEAVVTDNFLVASVTLSWTRSDGVASLTNMVPFGTNGQYRASIAAPGTNGDTFVYSIRAADPMGNDAVSGPHAFRVDYPVMEATPAALTDLLMRPEATETRLVTIANAGSTTLVVTIHLEAGGFVDDMEHGTNGWRHSGVADLWTLATQRPASPATAWYCGDPATLTYGNRAHARLDTPLVFVPPGAFLTFRHWIRTELDTRSAPAAKCWDGGLVEVSTDEGLTFTAIAPVGGYPYVMSGWSDSPWVEGTRCFAGTGAWQTATFDLAGLAGRSVIVRFHLGSDSNTPDEGWYVDDVTVGAIAAPTNAWIAIAPTNLLVDPQCSATVTVTVSSAAIATGDRAGLLRLLSDTPFLPAQDIPVYLKVRSPPVVEVMDAAQTATNGSGWVTISNTVADVDGDACSLEYQWSTNGGAAWLANAMVAAAASVGSPPVGALAVTPQVGPVLVMNGTKAITNMVAASWDTSTGSATLGLATDVLVRCRAWDGAFWSEPATSQPFLVDNQGPTAPAGLACPSHERGVWSSNAVLALTWESASDEGGGLAGYRYGLVAGVGILALSSATTGVTATVAAGADGTNWQALVQAVDVFGNLGPAATLEHFWIDTTPPAATGATVTVARSAEGNYVLGTVVSASWSGFTDPGSGLVGYYIAFTNGQGSPHGQWSPGSAATVAGAIPDATNTIYVWARDAVGLIGGAARATVVALSADGDWDRDGLPNAGEAVAGTDAGDAASALRVEPVPVGGSGVAFVVRWPGVANRSYRLAHREGLLPSGPWSDFEDATNLTGQAGFMSYTDRTAAAETRFYRVSVEPLSQP